MTPQAESCSKCGALVGDAEIHRAWHRKAEDADREARDAAASLRGIL